MAQYEEVLLKEEGMDVASLNTEENSPELLQVVKVKKKRKKKSMEEKDTNNELEIKKMKQGMSYTCKEKTIILNVFKYFRNQNPEKCVTDIVRRTAKATGCSEKSVFQFRKEESSSEGFKEPSKKKIRKNININSRDIKYDNTVRSTIRNIIYELHFKNIVPSLNTILKHISLNKQMPKFSVMTLRRLMFDMGFSYQKNGNKFVLIEKPDNRLLQENNQPQQTNEINQNQMPQNKPNIPLDSLHSVQQNVPRVSPPPLLSIAPPPDPRINPPMQKPMHIPLAPPVLTQTNNHYHIMGPSHHQNMMPSHPPNMVQKTMPIVTTRRDLMPTAPTLVPPSMDMHRKRDQMTPWMHGIIKQGQ